MSAVCCSSPAAAVRMVLSNDLPARTFFFTEISATPEAAATEAVSLVPARTTLLEASRDKPISVVLIVFILFILFKKQDAGSARKDVVRSLSIKVDNDPVRYARADTWVCDKIR